MHTFVHLLLGCPALGFAFFVRVQNDCFEALKWLLQRRMHANGTMQLKILQNFRWLHGTPMIRHAMLTCTSSKNSH